MNNHSSPPNNSASNTAGKPPASVAFSIKRMNPLYTFDPQNPAENRRRPFLLTHPHRFGAVQPFRQVNRIAHRNFVRIHLVGPDLEMRQPRLAVNRCERAIHRIRAVGDFNAADAGNVVARIKRQPFLPQIDLDSKRENPSACPARDNRCPADARSHNAPAD